MDTKPLTAGDYTVFLTQVGGKTHEIPMKVLPPGPRIENAPQVMPVVAAGND